MQTSEKNPAVFHKLLQRSMIPALFLLLASHVIFSAPADSIFEPEAFGTLRDTVGVGDQAPTFVLRELFSDEPVFLRDFTGESLRQPWKESPRHVVILSFWATWCEPCREEIPVLTELVKRFPNDPLQIFLINTQERSTMTEETLRLLVRQRGYSLPVLLDATGSVATRYGVRSLPTLIVIDKYGAVRKINRGFHPGFEKELEKTIRQFLLVDTK